MTIEQMHYALDLEINQIDSESRERLLPAEKDWILNEAIWVVLKQRYGILNAYRLGFEGNQKRIEDLKTLHIKYPLQPAVTPLEINPSLYEMKLSDLSYEYFAMTRMVVDATKGDCVKTIVVSTTQNDDLSYALKDPFNKPSFYDECVLINFGRSYHNNSGTSENPNNKGSVYFYTDGTFNITSVKPEYLKYPTRLWNGTYDLTTDLKAKSANNEYIYQFGVDPSASCDLDSEIHPEIVNVAALIATGKLNLPQYWQLKQQKVFNLQE